MNHLEALRDKIGRLRTEIAQLQELDNDYYRRHGRNWMHAEAQIAHDRRLERLQAIQQELPNSLALAHEHSPWNR